MEATPNYFFLAALANCKRITVATSTRDYVRGQEIRFIHIVSRQPLVGQVAGGLVDHVPEPVAVTGSFPAGRFIEENTTGKQKIGDPPVFCSPNE